MLLFSLLLGVFPPVFGLLSERWTENFVRRDSESLARIPTGWGRVAKAPADYVLTLKIGLKQHRFDELGKPVNRSS